MSTPNNTTTNRSIKRKRNRANRRAKKVEEGIQGIVQSAASTSGRSSQAIVNNSRSRNSNRREKSALRSIANFSQRPSRSGPITKDPFFKSVTTNLYQTLTRDFAPYQHKMLGDYLKALVDPYTNVMELGIQGRIPDATANKTAVISSKKIIPIDVLWTSSGNKNDGKFSLACRPVLGSFDEFDFYQDYLIGPNGWPDGSTTTFTSQELYSNELLTATNQSWPLAYDPNYPFLATSPNESFTYFTARPSTWGTYGNNTTITIDTPLGTGDDIPFLQRTPGLLVNVTNDGSNYNKITLPRGLWKITTTSTAIYAGTPVLDPEVFSLDDTCDISILDYQWVASGDVNPKFGVAARPNTLNTVWPNTVVTLNCIFYVKSTGTKNSSFAYRWVNDDPTLTDLVTTLFQGARCGVESGYYKDVNFSTNTIPFSILSETQADDTSSLGLASSVRPVAMSAWFKPSIAPIAQGGSITVSVVPRGVLEKSFLADAANTSPGQLQEFSSLEQIQADTCNFKVQDGCYAFWRVSDVNDYTFRNIVDTQKDLNNEKQQYMSIVISGVVPPTPLSTPSSDTVVNVGYVEVVRVFELTTASQLLLTHSYVGDSDILDVALQLIDRGGLTLVHENPLHWKDIKDWGKRVGLSIYNVGKKINDYTRTLTGMDAITLGTKALALAL